MAFRFGVRTSALLLHRHYVKTSSKIVGLVSPINNQRLLCSVVAPSSPSSSSDTSRGGGASPVTDAHKREDMIVFAELAVDFQNHLELASLRAAEQKEMIAFRRFVRVVSADSEYVSGRQYNIILEATDAWDGKEYAKKLFRATVCYKSFDKSFQLLKWEPVEIQPERKAEDDECKGDKLGY